MTSRDRPGKVEIEARWPRYDGSGKAAPELESLVGATILRIGTPLGLEVEGGGLAIEYEADDGRRRVLIFGFNEVGMWVEKG